MKKDVQINSDEFYGESVWDVLVINGFTYRGRGRPKKTDYIRLSDFIHLCQAYQLKDLNEKMNKLFFDQ